MKAFCYYINPTQDSDEHGGFVPSIVEEGVSGHRPLTGQGEGSSPWVWGKTLDQAEIVCRHRNMDKFDLTEKEACLIVASSMTA